LPYFLAANINPELGNRGCERLGIDPEKIGY
jgi:hypothetical protein